MKRAAVIVGVNKTGGLPELSDAVRGARQMEQWAIEGQKIPRELVRVHTDENGPVEIGAIKRSIRELVDQGTIEQLLVFFAGHGVNIRYGEYWLLSDAPRDTQAAVNVDGTLVLARQCGIPHVVLVSDACRTAAEGIQAQYVTGGEIFPNEPEGGPEKAVDLFFAASLGRPALEVKDPNDSAGVYRALYTGALVDALDGKASALIEVSPEPPEGFGVIRPRPLKKHLQGEVARRLSSLGLALRFSQVPDARITSEPEVWLSRVPLPPPETTRTRGVRGPGRGRPGRAPAVIRMPEAPGPVETIQSLSGSLLSAALRESPQDVLRQLQRVEGADPDLIPRADGLSRGFRRVTRGVPSTAVEVELKCGFKVDGAAIRRVDCGRARAVLKTPHLVEVRLDEGPAASVLMELENGCGVVIPALRDFVGSLVFDEGELADVAYEPFGGTDRGQAYRQQAAELRALRGVIAASARYGTFHLEGEDAPVLARRLQYSKGIDPAMALYAAYAYHDLQAVDRLRETEQYLRDDLGLRLFDVSLLARRFEGRAATREDGVFPWFPLLAQGWGLLGAYRARLPEGLSGLERQLRPSLWSLFDPEGTSRLRDFMQSGKAD